MSRLDPFSPILLFALLVLLPSVSRASLTLDRSGSSALSALSAKDDVVEARGDTATVLDIVGNDTVADMGKVNLLIYSQPLFGQLSVDETGRLLYSPIEGFVGSDSFYYLLQEGNRTAMARVVISVKGGGTSISPLQFSFSSFGPRYQ
ncbi:MAG: Ig-like domain-containing protein [Elusimicrobia bacterium]|nr:Ig-like domain-containing protein [Candidatus Obscuribacterium magneticum]